MQRVTSSLLVALLGVGVICWIAPAWSEDRTPDARLAAAPGKIYFLDGDRIACIQPDGRNQTQFSRVLIELGHFQPYTARVAPDGSRLAFGVGELRDRALHAPSKIHVMDMTKTQGVDLAVDLPGIELGNWAWSPDGKKLAFSACDAKDRTQNWVVDVQTKELQEIKLPPEKTVDGEDQMTVEDWSADGQSFVALAAGVHVVRTDGSQAKRLTTDKFTVHGGTCRFSPNGRNILFVGAEDEKSEALYVVDVAGGKPTPIVQFSNFSDLQACWSPDGRRIAYSVTFLDAQGKRGTESNLNVVDADGKNSVTIASATHETQVMKLLLIGWR